MVMKGKRGGHIPRRGKQVVGQGKTLTFGSQPRGTYSELEIDYMLVERDQSLVAAKSEPKTEKQELGLLRSPAWFPSEIGSSSGTRDESGMGVGGDDDEGDEDVCRDDDEDH
nr:hypothetical protein [Tanacetum cinerariifolium]